MTGALRSLLAAAVLGGVACSSSQVPDGSGAGPPVVVVTMREYRYQHPQVIPSGRVVFRFVNDGVLEHQTDLMPLAEDFPPIDQQIRGGNRRVVTPFAGFLPRKPGEIGTFDVDLGAGRRYALVCFARAPDDESHALKGMTSEFRPAAPATTSPTS